MNKYDLKNITPSQKEMLIQLLDAAARVGSPLTQEHRDAVALLNAVLDLK